MSGRIGSIIIGIIIIVVTLFSFGTTVEEPDVINVKNVEYNNDNIIIAGEINSFFKTYKKYEYKTVRNELKLYIYTAVMPFNAQKSFIIKLPAKGEDIKKVYIYGAETAKQIWQKK